MDDVVLYATRKAPNFSKYCTKAKGLPTLFITLTMAESKWIHLTEILRKTDNHDTIPTNRPYHVSM